MGLHDNSIYSILKRNSKVYGDRIALVSGDQRITHRQLLEEVDRLCYGLFHAGIKKGDRIGVIGENSIEFVYLYCSAAKLGAIVLPLNWRLHPKEIEYIISNGTPKILFLSSQLQELIGPVVSKYGFMEKIFAFGEGTTSFEPFNNLMDNQGICPEGDVHTDDDYVIIYTAAVEGRPKGAVLSHGNLISSNSQLIYYWSLTKEDVHLLMLPLFHIAGLGLALGVIQAGGANVILPRFEADSVLMHIEEDKVTVFAEFPPILQTMLENAKEGKRDLSSLRHVLGMDHPDIIKKFKSMSGGTFWVCYGQTETSGLVSIGPYSERPGAAGVPGFMVEAETMDDHGNILGHGKTGEIVVRGPMVFKGYWNLKEETDYTFRGGWHHTGDMGRFDEDGFLWYEGRKQDKELIKTGGENVYPAEVEKIILEHPAVEATVVFGVPDPTWKEGIKAVCKLIKGETLEPQDLISFVGERIARYKKPHYIEFVFDIPLLNDGSIDRTKTKELYGVKQ